ncbi:MAG: AMP-binding protein [Anaerolineae bacterium]
MPNFANNLSAKAVRDSDLEGMDLSCWRYLLNGSEPLLHTSHEAFIKRFGPYGFPNESLNSGYGLAENLVAVTLCPLYERAPEDTVVKSVLQEGEHAVPADETTPAEDTTTLVSSGVPIPNCEVRIVDEQGNDQPDRAIGEIIIRSDTLFEGYYERPDLTAEVFDEDGWFYTGDLGYFVEGHLYVIGREKDLIIVGGKNIYPHELEIIADSMRTLKPGRSVAFGVDDTAMGTEQIVMVCEVTDPEAVDALPEIERELRRRVTQALGVTIGDVRLVNDRWVIKTPSGKFARNDNRRKYFAEFAAE